VSTGFDREADFGQYRTFGFDPEIKKAHINEVNKRQIIEAITHAMELKGLNRVQGGELTVDVFVGGAREKVKGNRSAGRNHAGHSTRATLNSGCTTDDINPENYVAGTIFIDVVDSNRRRLIWQGRGSALLCGDQEVRESRIIRAIEKIFAYYPPNLD
jgi:hypothetical protein